MSQHPGRRQAAGFSIIEMAAVVAMVAILLAVGIPSFRQFIVNYRATAQANDLIADIAFARGEAAKLGRTVQVVATSGVWNSGWIVGADLDANGSITGTEQFRQHGAVDPEFNFTAAGGIASLSFGPAGQLTVPTTGAEIAICQPAGFTRHRVVLVNAVGRAQICAANSTNGSLSHCSTLSCP